MENNTKYYQRCPHCGGRAWRYKIEPYRGMFIKAAYVEHSDNPKPGDPLTCQLCKAAIRVADCTTKTIIVDK